METRYFITKIVVSAFKFVISHVRFFILQCTFYHHLSRLSSWIMGPSEFRRLEATWFFAATALLALFFGVFFGCGMLMLSYLGFWSEDILRT